MCLWLCIVVGQLSGRNVLSTIFVEITYSNWSLASIYSTIENSFTYAFKREKLCYRKPGNSNLHWRWLNFKRTFWYPQFFQKKWTKTFDLTTMIPQVDLFFFGFWKNLKTPKRHFEINWPWRTDFVSCFLSLS